jgi:hypothetical protein
MSTITVKAFIRAHNELRAADPTYAEVVVTHHIIQNVALTIDKKRSEAKAAKRYWPTPDITVPVCADIDNFVECRLKKYPEVFDWAIELKAADLIKHRETGDEDAAIEWSWPTEISKYLLEHPHHAIGVAMAFNPTKHKPKERYLECIADLQQFLDLVAMYNLEPTDISATGVSVKDQQLEAYENLCLGYLSMFSNPETTLKSPLFVHLAPYTDSPGYRAFLTCLHTLTVSLPASLWISHGGFGGAVVCSPYGIDSSRSNVVKATKFFETLTSSGWEEFQRYVKMGAGAMEGLRNLAS